MKHRLIQYLLFKLNYYSRHALSPAMGDSIATDLLMQLRAYYCFCHVGLAALDKPVNSYVKVIDGLDNAVHPDMLCGKAIHRSQSSRGSFGMYSLLPN